MRHTSTSPPGDDDKEHFFITTPIFYVNASPHLGHLYSAVTADCLHRYKLLRGFRSKFSTGESHDGDAGLLSTIWASLLLTKSLSCVPGTDEHGLKVQRAADAAGKDPRSFCSDVSGRYRDVFARCDVSYTDFIRTSGPEHRRAVESFWTALRDAGLIYKGSYQGWYSTQDESFLTPLQVADASDSSGKDIKISLESGHKVKNLHPLTLCKSSSPSSFFHSIGFAPWDSFILRLDYCIIELLQ